MAFNPFNFFRKYQKVIFGIMAIICMFVFVLQFGAGDPFTRAINSFSGDRDKGPTVAKLYGRKVHKGDLDKLSYDRQIASEFLFSQFVLNYRRVGIGDNASFREPAAAQEFDKIPGPLRDTAKEILNRARERGHQIGRPLDPAQRAKHETDIQNDLDLLRNLLVFSRTGDKPEYLALDGATRGLLDDLVLYLQFDRYVFGAGSNIRDMDGLPRGTNRTYYLGGGKSPAELLDFLVWKQQADTRGISLTEAAVLRLCSTYTGSKAGTTATAFADDKRVQEYLQFRQGNDRNRVTAKDLLAALQQEFRVALAREELVGVPAPGTFPALGLSLLPTSPAQTSTAEGYEVYRKLTATATVGLLEIPVAAYLDKVKGQPTDKEIADLFEKYKNDEVFPDSDRPGFKEPRRVKVQYLHVTGDSPYIRERAQQLVTVSEAMRPVGALIQAATLVNNPLLAAASVAADSKELPIHARYEEYTADPAQKLDSWQYPALAKGVRDTSWVRQGPLRALVGNLAASSFTTSSPLVPLVGYLGIVEAFDKGDLDWQSRQLRPGFINGEVAKVTAAHLAGAGVGPAYAGAAGPLFIATAVLQHKAEFLEPLPFEVIAPVLRYKRQTEQEEQVKGAVRGGLLNEAYAEIAKHRGKPESEVKASLEKWLADKNMTQYLHTAPYAQDRWQIRKEPALADVRGIFDRVYDPAQTRGPDLGGDLLAGMMQAERGTYDPLRWSPQRRATEKDWVQQIAQFGRASIDDLRKKASEDFASDMALPNALVLWRTEDRNPEMPKELTDFVTDKDQRITAKAKVIAAWKWMQAQTLAKEDALKVRDEIKKAASTEAIDAVVQNLRDRRPGTFKEITNLGRLVPGPASSFGGATYRPGVIHPYQIEYPKPDTIETLMDNLKAVGDVTILSDQPVKHWYVALCQTRSENSTETYRLQAGNTTLGLNDRFYTQYIVPHQERAYEEKLLKRLRRDAGKDDVKADGTWHIPSGIKTYDRGDLD